MMMTSYLETIFDVEIFRFYCFFFSISFLFCLFLTYLKPLNNRRAVLDSQQFKAPTLVMSSHWGIRDICLYFISVPISVFLEGNVKFFNWLIVSSVPVFIIGVSEDLGVAMSPCEDLWHSDIRCASCFVIRNLVEATFCTGVDLLMG